MLIVGAKGFAKELLEVIYQNNQSENIVFYDDISNDIGEELFGAYPILKKLEEAQKYLIEKDNRFALGIGNPYLRYKMAQKFLSIGGQLYSVFSKFATIGSFENNISKEGVIITGGCQLTNSITIEQGCLLNLNTTVGHDSYIGQFCELSPGVHLSGHSYLGQFCNIGTGAIVLPKIRLGNNVIVGAGSVVTKDIPDNSLVVGVPAKIIKELVPIKI